MANSFDPYIGLIKKMAKPFVPTAKAFAKATSLPKINIKTPTYNKPKALAPVDYTSKEKKSPLFSIKMSRKESPNPKPINLEIPEISKNISQDISNDQLGSMGWGRYNAEPVEKITPIENISYGKYNGAFKDAELKKPEASGILSLRGQEKISETAFDVADNVGTFFDDIINTKGMFPTNKVLLRGVEGVIKSPIETYGAAAKASSEGEVMNTIFNTLMTGAQVMSPAFAKFNAVVNQPYIKEGFDWALKKWGELGAEGAQNLKLDKALDLVPVSDKVKEEVKDTAKILWALAPAIVVHALYRDVMSKSVTISPKDQVALHTKWANGDKLTLAEQYKVDFINSFYKKTGIKLGTNNKNLRIPDGHWIKGVVPRRLLADIQLQWEIMTGKKIPSSVIEILKNTPAKNLEIISKRFSDMRDAQVAKGGIRETGLVGLKPKSNLPDPKIPNSASLGGVPTKAEIVRIKAEREQAEIEKVFDEEARQEGPTEGELEIIKKEQDLASADNEAKGNLDGSKEIVVEPGKLPVSPDLNMGVRNPVVSYTPEVSQTLIDARAELTKLERAAAAKKIDPTLATKAAEYRRNIVEPMEREASRLARETAQVLPEALPKELPVKADLEAAKEVEIPVSQQPDIVAYDNAPVLSNNTPSTTIIDVKLTGDKKKGYGFIRISDGGTEALGFKTGSDAMEWANDNYLNVVPLSVNKLKGANIKKPRVPKIKEPSAKKVAELEKKIADITADIARVAGKEKAAKTVSVVDQLVAEEKRMAQSIDTPAGEEMIALEFEGVMKDIANGVEGVAAKAEKTTQDVVNEITKNIKFERPPSMKDLNAPMPLLEKVGQRHFGDSLIEAVDKVDTFAEFVSVITGAGYKDGFLRDPKVIAMSVDYNLDVATSNNVPEQLINNIYSLVPKGEVVPRSDLNPLKYFESERLGGLAPKIQPKRKGVENTRGRESLMIALTDAQLRSLLYDRLRAQAENKRRGNPVTPNDGIPQEFQGQIEDLYRENKALLDKNPVAQKMVDAYNENRLIVIDDLIDAGAIISPKMRDNPNYFPKDIRNPFDYKAKTGGNAGAGSSKANFTKRKKFSELSVNPNLPQTLMEFYQSAYNAIPAMKVKKRLVEEFALKDPETGKYMKVGRDGKGIPDGYVAYQENKLKLHPEEVLNSNLLQDLASDDGVIDYEKYKKQILAAGAGPTYIISEEAARWIEMENNELEANRSMLRDITGFWKGWAVMSNPAKYFIRNIFSDGIGGAVYANNIVNYMLYYSKLWGEMTAYYTNGTVSPMMREILDHGMLEMGFASEGWDNKLLNSPVLSRFREEVVSGSSNLKGVEKAGNIIGEASKTSYLAWQNFVRMQEAVARGALAIELGGGHITPASAAEANFLLVNFKNMKDARRGLEVVHPFLQWASGTMQSIFRTLTMQQGKYMKFTNKQRFWKGMKGWGFLFAGPFLYYSLVNNDDEEDIDEAEVVARAGRKTLDTYTTDELYETLMAYRDLGGWVPANFAIMKNSEGKPIMTSGGGLLLMVADTPGSATSFITDPIKGIAEGALADYISSHFNSVVVGAGEVLFNKRTTGGPVYDINDPAWKRSVDGLWHGIKKMFPIVNTTSGMFKKGKEGGIVRNKEDFATMMLQYSGPFQLLDMNLAIKKLDQLDAEEGLSESIYEENQAKDAVKKLDKNFSPYIENFIGHAIKEKYNAPQTLFPGLRDKDPNGLAKAKQAWSFLQEQGPKDQLELVSAVVRKFRDPSILALYGETPAVVINTLKRQYDVAKEKRDVAPTRFGDKRMSIIAYIAPFSNEQLDNIANGSPEAKASLTSLLNDVNSEPVTSEERDFIEAQIHMSKIIGLVGKSDEDIYLGLNAFGKNVFGENWTPDMEIDIKTVPSETYAPVTEDKEPIAEDVQAPQVTPPTRLGQLPGVNAPSNNTSVRTLPTVTYKKPKDRKKVELKPVSFNATNLRKLSKYNY